jgi:hypothetical protein
MHIDMNRDRMIPFIIINNDIEPQLTREEWHKAKARTCTKGKNCKCLKCLTWEANNPGKKLPDPGPKAFFGAKKKKR